MKPLPVLIVEDDASLREALTDTLELSGYEVLQAADGAAALELLEGRTVGLVVSDVQMKPMDGEQLLREIKRRCAGLPVLLMTAYGMIERAVEAMRAGACNYLPKPFEPEALVAEVARWMLPASAQTAGRADRARPGFAAAAGAGAARRRVRGHGADHRRERRGQGSPGALHPPALGARGPGRSSRSTARPSPRTCSKPRLFGYEKGAFTGAAAAARGKFEQAQGGTLLLDEISEMPAALQAKLLRVLQEREVERVGGKKPIALDVRMLATSNRDLQAEVQGGRFREDLYYRLNVFPLHVPPLRSRPLDIVPLAQRVLQRAAQSRALDACRRAPRLV